jgi:hypothetical protein
VQHPLLPLHRASIDLSAKVLQWRVENLACGWWGIQLALLR